MYFSGPVTASWIAKIMTDRSPQWRRLRDLAAYIEVTGVFPTHLRGPSNEALRLICDVHPTILAAQSHQAWTIKAEYRQGLEMDRHPLVIMAHSLKERGFKVARQGGRRSYARVKFERARRVVWALTDGFVVTRDPDALGEAR